MDVLAAEFDLNTVKTVSIIAIGVLVLLAVLFAVIIRKIVGKIIMVVLMIALAVAIYTQRDNLKNCEPGTTCTFFGVNVDVPDADIGT